MGVIEDLKFLRKFTQKNRVGVFGLGGGGGQGGCERRIEVSEEIHTKKSGGGGDMRDVNQE